MTNGDTVPSHPLTSFDWKYIHLSGKSKEGDSNGCDFAGDVVKLGKSAGGKGVELGDVVAGFVLPPNDPTNGSFQGRVLMYI